MYSDKEFDSYIKNLFKDMSMSPGYRFIVGMGDNLPFDGDIERVGQAEELIDKYGSIPIEKKNYRAGSARGFFLFPLA